VSGWRFFGRAVERVRFEPRWFFLVYVLVGLPYLLLTGPFRAPDERNHFLRAYEVSEGRLNGARVVGDVTGDDLPASLSRLSEVLGDHADHHIEPAQIEAARALELRPAERRFIEFSTAVYSPLAYVPAAAALALGRIFSAGPLALIYFARSANLIAGGLLVTLALCYAGYARRALLVIAILPMVLSQIATVTVDATSYGISFLWIALVLDTAINRTVALTPKRVFCLFALALGLSQLRLPYPLLGLLIFLVPITARRRKTILLWIGIVGASLVPAISWTAAAAPLFRPAPTAAIINPAAQVQWLLKHPGIFWHRAKQDLADRAFDYWEQFVGRLGWLNIRLPLWVPIGFALLLAAGIILGPRDPPGPLWWQRLALAITAFGAILGAQLVLYLTFNSIHSPFILGMQGRYFTVPVVLAAFACAGSRFSRPTNEIAYRLGLLLFGFGAHCAALFALARAAGKI
jgi:uncharacterized membrane protein